jgi:hypothetical protein
VKVPVADPLSVLAPIGLPLPWIVALPEAFVPLAWPEPVPMYVAEKECTRAAPAGPTTRRAATVVTAAARATLAAGCRGALIGRA